MLTELPPLYYESYRELTVEVIILRKLQNMFCLMSSTATFKTPAPGAYSPEKVHPQGERHAPAYSMGSRSRYRKRKYAHFYPALLNSSDLIKENKEIGIWGHSGDP